MAKLSVVKGATSVLARVFIQDATSTTGAGKSGLVFNTSGLTCYQMRDDDGNAGATVVALVTATLGTWTSKGFKEKDATNAPGWYEFGIPNAALVAGSRTVGFHFQGATGMAPLPVEIEITGWDNQDAVHGGLTALPNAAAGANGGLPLSVDTSGRVDVLKVNGTSQTARDLGASVLISPGTGTGQLDVTSGVVKANLVQILATALTETAGLLAGGFKKFFNVAGPTLTIGGTDQTGDNFARLGAPAGASIAADLAEIEAETDGIAAIPTTPVLTAHFDTVIGSPAGASVSADIAAVKADVDLSFIRRATAQAGAGTTITLDSGASASNSFYNNTLLLITSGTGAGQARFISAYVGATKVATVATWVTNPDNTSVFLILPFDSVAGASAPTAAQVATAVWQDLLAGSDFTTASSIGKLLHDDIDAAISSRMATFATPTNFSSLSIDSSGRVNAFLIGILTSVFTEGATGRIAAAFKQWFNVATPTSTMNEVTLVDTTTALTTNNDKTGYGLTAAYDPAKTASQAGDAMALTSGERTTLTAAIWNALTSGLTTVGSVGKRVADFLTGDAFARLGAPAGASVSADVAAVKGVLPTALDGNGFIKADIEDWKASTAPAMTGDAFARLGAPAGASIAADVAAVKSDTGTTLTDVHTGAGALYSRIGAPVGASLAADVAAVKSDTAIVATSANAEPTSVPAANASVPSKIAWLFMLARNKITSTSTTQLVKADDGTTTVGTSTVSDDGTVFTRGKLS